MSHEHELVLVVDFGAQYAQLIARRVREARIYSEIVPHTASVDDTRLIARTQAILSSLGFDAGPADGKMGRKTRDAIAAFQTSKGLPATGEIDKTLIEALGMRLI